MKRKALKILFAVVLAPMCLYLGYKLAYPTYTYRYRLSVEVETPDGLRSGSSVIEVRYEMFPKINAVGVDHVSRVFGEAVFIDLGLNKNLVALLATGSSGQDVDYPGGIVPLVFNLDGNDPNTPKRLTQLRGKRDLDIHQPNPYGAKQRFLPTFVTFGDPTDFHSVKLAPPWLFEEIFGAGYKLHNVSIEMTLDPPTEQIQKELPWLPHPRYLNGLVGCGPGDSMYCLHGGHFVRSY